MTELQIWNAALIRTGQEPVATLVETNKRSVLLQNQYEVTLRELLNDTPWNFAVKKVKLSLQSKAILSWSNVGTTVTLVVATGHGFIAGDAITVNGLVSDTFPPNIAGVAITSVTATTIVYTFTDTPTGTPTIDSTIAYVKAGGLFGFKYRYALPSDCLRVLELEDKAEFRVESNGILTDSDTFIQIKYIFYNDDTTKFSGSFIKIFVLKLAEDISYALVQSSALQQSIIAEADRYLRRARSYNSQEGSPESRYPEEYTVGIRR